MTDEVCIGGADGVDGVGGGGGELLTTTEVGFGAESPPALFVPEGFPPSSR